MINSIIGTWARFRTKIKTLMSGAYPTLPAAEVEAQVEDAADVSTPIQEPANANRRINGQTYY